MPFQVADMSQLRKNWTHQGGMSAKDQKNQHQGVKKLLEESADLAMDSLQEEYTLFAVGSTDGRSAIEVELELDGHRICMEIDTGASLSLVSEATFKRLWPGRSLQPSTVRLKTYTSVAGVGIGTSSCERRQGTSS